jgi:hypothetical protein
MSKQNHTPPSKHLKVKRPMERTKKEARALLLRVAPGMIKPGMIRKLIRRSLPGQSKRFLYKLDAVLVLVDQLYDLDQQEYSMNPGLLKAQQNGSIKRKFDETARTLARGWKELMDEFTA